MSQSENAAKKKALELALSHIEKEFGEGTVMSLGIYSSRKQISVIPTGAIPLDLALGIGGVPRGRIVEIYGHESSGKSTLATHIVANCQKGGGTAVYIDAEHALDPGYAARIGVNLNELLISQPDCGEDALNIAEALARSNAVDLIVVDSVAALMPRAELEGDIGDAQIGLLARLMSQALRKLTATLAKSNTCTLFINQIREKVGVMFGNPETTTGGRALKFYASGRIEIKRIAFLKGADNNNVGIRVKANVVKNKLAPPFRTAEFDILFNEGISRTSILLELGAELGILDKRGPWYSYNGNRLGQGKEATRDLLKTQPALTDEIEAKVLEKMKGNQAYISRPTQDKGETEEREKEGAALDEEKEALSERVRTS